MSKLDEYWFVFSGGYIEITLYCVFVRICIHEIWKLKVLIHCCPCYSEGPQKVTGHIKTMGADGYHHWPLPHEVMGVKDAVLSTPLPGKAAPKHVKMVSDKQACYP